VNNDGNYLMKIFEGEKRREFELCRNIDAVNEKLPETSNEALFLKKGLLVMLYHETPDEVWVCSPVELAKRLYSVQGLSSMTLQKKYKYGVIVLMHALESRMYSDLKMQDGDFRPDEPYIPLRKCLHTRFKALVQGRDFELSSLGELRRL